MSEPNGVMMQYFHWYTPSLGDFKPKFLVQSPPEWGI